MYGGGDVSTVSVRTEAKPPEPEPWRPPDDTCPELPGSTVVSGYGEGVQCKRLGVAGVANDELIAQGIVDAVDVWGSVNTIVRVCFRNQGALRFLDAATSPRALSDLAAETIDGMTCGSINRAGTVVLIEAAGDVGSVAAGPASADAAQARGCQLVTTGYLSLRAGPSTNYMRMLSMPSGTRLLATARTDDWFMVDYEEQAGWVSGSYVTASTDCSGIDSAAGRVFLQQATELAQTAISEPGTVAESEEAEMAGREGKLLSDCRLTAGDIINLRQGPGLDYEVDEEIPNQTRLIATERSEDWFKVEYNSIEGWVNIDYVFRNGTCA